MNEIWKDIIGFEGKYQISNLGRVKRLTYRGTLNIPENKLFLPFSLAGDGYKMVKLSTIPYESKSINIHRLVALHFVDNPQNKSTVNHIDGNKLNNRWDNLEWNTVSENTKHAYDMGLRSYHGKNGIQIIATNLKTKEETEFPNTREASRVLGFDSSSITKCCRGKLKQVKGYHFKYKNPEEMFIYKTTKVIPSL